MEITFNNENLSTIMPSASQENINFYLSALNEQLPKYEINTALRASHFIAQIAHESGNFRYKIENLNYSASALITVFGKYFTSEEMAEDYARKPEKIANVAYANRMGNGDTESGEGWKYRGRGLIQLTGKENYITCRNAINVDIVENPDLICTDPDIAVAVACWFWQSRNLNSLADSDDIKQITKRINGGYNGIKDREECLTRAKATFNI